MTKDVDSSGPDGERAPEFRRNERLETLLGELSTLLGPAEEQATEGVGPPPHVTVFVLGAPRVGTTLTMQWLAASGAFCYPTNLLSRFYAAPYLGILIQKLLCDPQYDFKEELFDLRARLDWTSDIGKTRGALSPHEFWYFWRRFFPFGDVDVLDPEQRQRADRGGFAREVAAMQLASGLPVAMKAGIINLEVPFVAEAFPKALFVHVTRDPVLVIQSVLEARQRHAGSRDAWYSFRPAEYHELRRLDPVEQVTGQIYYLEQGIRQGLRALAASRTMTLPYDRLCREPSAVWTDLATLAGRQGDTLGSRHPGPASFAPSDRLRLSRAEADRIAAAWKGFGGEVLDPARWSG